MDYQNLVLEHCDPDQLLEVIDGTDVVHRVLPGGELRARVEKIHLDASVVQRGYYGMGVVADGAMPSGVISIGIITGTRENSVINGFACPLQSVQLYPEGCEISYRALPENSWVVYCIERDRIQEVAVRLCGRPLPIPPRSAVSIEPDETDGRRILATVEALFALGTHPKPGMAVDALAQQLEEQLICELACALNKRQHAGDAPDVGRIAQRRDLMRRAEDYLRANVSEPYSLSGLAAAAGMNHRTLQRYFRSIYGVTPHVWFRCMKLNAVRGELRQSSVATVRISDIAARWGFLHFGRFAEDYRKLFGERPKDTLRS
jgi:AraC family ethanolamine operon transcriptional activator